MKTKVELTVFDWHNILKILEHQMSVVNAGRFTGLGSEQVERLYVKIAEQLHEQENEPE